MPLLYEVNWRTKTRYCLKSAKVSSRGTECHSVRDELLCKIAELAENAKHLHMLGFRRQAILGVALATAEPPYKEAKTKRSCATTKKEPRG